MSAFVRELIFNTKRPFGPMKAADTCEVGQKHVRFSSSLTKSIHVDLGHGMQCSALEYGHFRHIMSFELSGMQEYEHGRFNGVAIVINQPVLRIQVRDGAAIRGIF